MKSMKRGGNPGRGRQWLERMKRTKRTLSIGLALLLAAGLCACGGGTDKEGADKESTDKESTGGGGNGRLPVEADEDWGSARQGDGFGNANSALAKEKVYRVMEIELPGMAEDGSISVESAVYLNDGIYAVIKSSKGDEIPLYCVLHTDEGGNVLGSAFLELPENSGAELPGGAGSELSGGAGDGEAAAKPDPNVWEQVDVRYGDFVTGADGRTYALRRYKYAYVNYLTEQSLEEQHEYVCCWDEKGRLLWQSEPWGEGGEALSVWAVFPAADGTSELLLTGERTCRLSLGADGVPSEAGPERLSEDTGKALGNCKRLLRREDGSCLLLYRNEAGSLSLVKYEVGTDTLGEPLRLPDSLSDNALGSTAFAAGTDSDLIYADRSGVFSCNMGDTLSSLKMDYVNSDRMITDPRFLLALDETHFLMFFKEDYGRELKAGVFEYVKPEDIPDKSVILLGGLTVNGGIKRRVVQYNRESEKYRVVVKEYPSAGDLNLEIVSGRMPDILVTERIPGEDSIPMESYIAKGMIADVGKLIEEDEELSGTEFLTNVFEAYSVDGRLMYMVPSFTLTTMAAKASHVGDGSGWSMEKMREVLEKMGSRAQLLDGLDRNTFMEKLLEYRGRDFIDLKTGKCAFDSPEFIEIMKFARTLPEERQYAAESGEGEYELQYLKDRTLLMELSVWTFTQNVDERLFYQLNGYLGGDYTLVGFPGSFGGAGGALIRGRDLMALSALSETPEGAWDFARYYLTEEYQRSLESSLPVNKRMFEEWALEETRRSYVTDVNGKKEEYDLTLYQGGEQVAVEPLSQEQLDELIAYVESVATVPFEDVNVLNIINEELGSYFSGQKTAEDVAAMIQSRVQVYVQENQ